MNVLNEGNGQKMALNKVRRIQPLVETQYVVYFLL